jgi:dipeptidyl aminopeptidase/acylaminoacyl peptidase
MIWKLAAALTCAALAAGSARAQSADAFVDRASVFSAQISPGGKEVAFIRRTEEQQQLVIVDLASNKARAIQTLKPSQKMELDWVRWKGDSRLVIGATAEIVEEGRAPIGGLLKSEDFVFHVSRVFALDTNGGSAVQMFQGQIATLAGGAGSTDLVDELPADPDHVLIRAVENSGIGAWKGNIRTGKVEQVANGSWQTRSYATDGKGYPVLRLDSHPNRVAIHRRASGAETWIPAGEVRRATAIDTAEFDVVGAGPGANQVYMIARANNSDRAALHLYDTASGQYGPALAPVASADAAMPWINPSTRELIATCEFAARLACRTVDPTLQKYMNALDQFFEGGATVSLVSMSADATKWLLLVEEPISGAAYFVFDRVAVQMDKLVEIYPGVVSQPLSNTEVVPYDSRDGTKLWAYVTARPAGGPRPMVVLPHGGPEARDYFGFNRFAQFLAAQGYVVVQPNFRGSSGFGESFINAGMGQWGARMQDDVSDVVKHLVGSGVADPARVCIVGASYGGYAALAGVTLTPDLYKCAVSVAGISDLTEILRSERSSGGASSNVYYYWRESIGKLESDAAALDAASPVKHAARVKAPVLLIHGDDDETVPVRQSMIMHDALRAAGKSSKLIRLPKSDHYWDDWERKDRLTLYQEVAAFLKQHLN